MTKPKTKDMYQKTVLELFRKVLSGVQLEDIDFPDQLQGQERIEFLTYCSMVASSPWFPRVFSALHWPHIVHAAKQAENYDIVTFNRATSNGVSLAQEFFNKYANRYKIEFEKPAPGFDPHKPFNNVES